MKKVNKIFICICISLIVVFLIIFLLPYIMGEDTRFWDAFFLIFLLPVLIYLEALTLFIHNIISPAKTLSIRIFRRIQGIIAVFELPSFILFFLGNREVFTFVTLIAMLGIIISLWIAEISVRLVIRHRNKKAIQKAE